MKKKPTSVMVLGERIKITYHKTEPMTDTVGLFDPETMSIQILDDIHVEDVIGHEILHAILHISGLNNLFSQEVEEALVSGISNGLFSLYSRNF